MLTKGAQPTISMLLAHCYILLMIGLPLAGDGLVHAGLLGLGILAALLFYAYEKRRRGPSAPRLWPIAGFAVAFGAIASRGSASWCSESC